MLGGINLRPLAALVVLIMALQAAGQLALRWLGVRNGVLVSGLVSGFVSSTATIASFGSRAAAQPAQAAVWAAGAAMSATATWIQALLMTTLLSPSAVVVLLPTVLAGAAGAAGGGALPVVLSGAGAPAAQSLPATGSALRPRVALMVALMLGGVALLVASAQRYFGDPGLVVGVGLAALADAHAPIATLAALHAGGSLPPAHLVMGVVLAVGANTLTRCGVAALAGGRVYALRVAAALLLSLGLAAATAWWTLLR